MRTPTPPAFPVAALFWLSCLALLVLIVAQVVA